MSSYPISPRLAEQAARDFLTLLRAGLSFELEREIALTAEAHVSSGIKLDDWRYGNGWALQQAHHYAERLAKLLNCEPSDVAPYLVPDLLTGETRRTIAVSVLRDMAARTRRQPAGRARS